MIDRKVYYSMDELGKIFNCTRLEALEYTRANRLLTVRHLGDTYISEDELVKHLMERHLVTKGC